MMKTVSVKASDIKREWHTIDAADEVLGKLATRAANLLMGKHKPLFSRNADVGDFGLTVMTDIFFPTIPYDKISIKSNNEILKNQFRLFYLTP